MGLKNTFIYKTLAAAKRSFQIMKTLFFGQGFIRSVLDAKPVGPDDEPIPWFTYPAIEYLKQFDFSAKRIFEYGSGNSSLFWARHAKEVIAVESDRRWFEHVARTRPPNLLLLLETDKENYVSSIRKREQKFDVIVIDGQWRNACANICADHLMDHGMIIFDNSDRHYDGCTKLRGRGFFQIDFSGFSPINGYASTTSLFIRAPTSLQSNFSPADPVGGLRQLACADD